MYKYKLEDVINEHYCPTENKPYAISIKNENDAMLKDFFDELEARNIRMVSGRTVKESVKNAHLMLLVFRENLSEKEIEVYYTINPDEYTVINLSEINFKSTYREINIDDWETII